MSFLLITHHQELITWGLSVCPQRREIRLGKHLDQLCYFLFLSYLKISSIPHVRSFIYLKSTRIDFKKFNSKL